MERCGPGFSGLGAGDRPAFNDTSTSARFLACVRRACLPELALLDLPILYAHEVEGQWRAP